MRVTLKEHFEKILAEKDKAINIALIAAEKASLKTEQAQRDYNVTHNDLLRKMDDQYKMMIPRTEFDAYKVSAERLLAVDKESRSAWITKFIGWVIAAAAIAIAYLKK